MKNKKLSIVVPNYNNEKYLKKCIECLLQQTYKNIEIIIVDDNDPNSLERKHTENIISNFDACTIKYIKHSKNLNGAVARNTGINASNGKYICFLDDDDFYLPNRVELSVKTLDENKLYDAVFCNVAIYKNKSITNVIYTGKHEFNQKKLLLDEMLIGTGSNIFMRKQAIVNLNGFDTKFIRHQDLEFLIRFSELYKAIGIDEVLVVKGTNGTNNIPEYNKLMLVKQQYFDKFDKQIKKLELLEQNEFYKYHYGILLLSAIESKDIKNINYMVKKYRKYGKLNIKHKILIVLVKLKLYKSPIYNFIKFFILNIIKL